MFIINQLQVKVWKIEDYGPCTNLAQMLHLHIFNDKATHDAIGI